MTQRNETALPLDEATLREATPRPWTYRGPIQTHGASLVTGQDPDWKPSDADRMATYFAFEHGVDPRVEQIVGGRFA